MREGTEMEVLLVLCCLVAVCVFLCFSLGAVNLGASVGIGGPAEASTSRIDLTQLDARRRELDRAIADLSAEIERLLEEIAEKQKQWAATPPAAPPEHPVQQRGQRLADLEKQLRELLKRIEELKAEVERARQNAERRAQTEADLRIHEEKRKGLLKQLEEKRKILEEMQIPVDPSAEQSLQKLREQISGLDRKIDDLRKQLAQAQCPPGAFCVKHLTGPTTLKNPVIVECTSGYLVVHPEGKVRIAVAELDRRNPFSSWPGKPDGIAFLIRPDGFDAFHKGYALAKEVKPELRIIYVPVEADAEIQF